MVKSLKRKLNNSGSTLVVTMIIIAFLSILATVILTASATNLAMKQAANKSKNTFYSAEAAVDEIYAGLGMASMDALSVAYVEVASSLVEITNIGGISVAVEVNNEVANKRLKEYFIENIFYEMTNTTAKGHDSIEIGTIKEEDKAALEYIKEYLGGFLTNKEAAHVEDISGVSMKKKDASGTDVYSVVLEDVVIRYVTKDGYFANVTVDISVDYPDITAGFHKEEGKLTAFSEYALIADGNINLSGNSVIIENNILAGTNINVFNGSKVTVNGNGAVNVVSGKDINVISDGINVVNGLASALYINGCDIWCENITLSTTTGTAGSTLVIDDDSDTYVKDDLNVNGLNSSATVGGNYYGYSYQGYSSGEGNPQDNSSAIVINGRKSKLSLTATNILIGGHAYINFGEAGAYAYMTGESLSVKGNQEIYLLVDQYIIGEGVDGNPVQNPMSYDDWMKISENNAIVPIDTEKLESKFYAYNLLDESKPYIIKYVETEKAYYVYLNFSSKMAATKYFMTIVSDYYFEELYPRATVAQQEERGALKNIINVNLVNMMGEGTSINISNDSTVMSSGAVFEVSSGNSVVESLVGTGADFAEGSNYADYVGKDEYSINSPTYNIPEVTVGGETGFDGFAVSSINFSNRFDIISHLCLDVKEENNGKEFIVYEPISTFEYKNEIYTTTDENLSTSAANNIVDFEEIKERGYNTECISVNGSLVTAVDGSVIVKNTVDRGIILATGDVTISADFTGIIITQGNINVTNNATITNCALNLVPRYENVLKYLYAYDNAIKTEGDSIESVAYTDIVKLSDWRKNEE